MDRVFATPSTRMDVYYDALVEYGQALPAYEPPLEAHAGNKLAETYPLQLANVRTRYRIHKPVQRCQVDPAIRRAAHRAEPL